MAEQEPVRTTRSAPHQAKIVATLGPASDSVETITHLIEAGMNVARLNLSHGTHEVHAQTFANIKEASTRFERPIGIIADLQGPKIRLGTFEPGEHTLVSGQTFTITTEPVEGTAQRASTTFAGLPGDCHPGDPLLIDDGNIQLTVREVTETDVVCDVVVGGRVSDHKGISLPGVAVSVPALSTKDEDDLRWALRTGVDMIALSFVRSADDVQRVHEIMNEEGVHLPVIAKIEKPQAIANLHEIVAAFDLIMIARGDLGVEMPLEQVPEVQKRAIELARQWAKPVIVATQMLESMISNPRPTRAEASDCANAVLDGADALMLSGETSVGAYPVEAVHTMANIITATEKDGLKRIPALGTVPHTQSGAITRAAAQVGRFLGAKYVCVFTTSGDSARRMGRLREPLPMLAFTYDEATRRRMSVMWGVRSVIVPFLQTTDEIVLSVDTYLIDSGLAEVGDIVIVVLGSPPGIPGSTNDLRVLRVGDAVNEAAPGYRHAAAQLMSLTASPIEEQ
ncbi:MAG: pyruvate kinase [Microbacteriaceae bacterium]|jgi:pyruvate kinase|nr:pyruvate kinase [Microbacteriaceae bacterium]MCI1206745.1 pyruvate kinase [Microbacteriaceae bacterium]